MVNQELYDDHHVQVDFEHKQVKLDNRPIQLTRKEFELLAELVQNAGEIVPREQLLLDVWNYGPQIRTRTLDVHIRRLRRKLGHYGDRYIETIFGVGYRFQPYREPTFLNVLRATA
ncbi:MAG: winged helix-turn-helix transcriptional regulator [Acidimicrobiia bacterium]|nr:winged helix-turn-helix transcriptional regulator [Acidimicrobiia bacterium]